MKLPGSQRGFTLVEVLVAFAIAVLALASILEIFSTGLRGIDTSGAYAEAVLLAESKLEATGIEETVEAGTTAGKFGPRFRWQSDIRPTEHRAPDESGEQEILAYDIDITVSWGRLSDERSVTLSTTRIFMME
jgi:general secretion pathway protein I